MAGEMTFNGKPLSQTTATDWRVMPDSLLIGMLRFHCRHHGAQKLGEQREGIIAEARRRGIRHWALTQLAPDLCACGRKGWYVVGQTTYCDRCKGKARLVLQQVASTLIEPFAMEHERVTADVERALRRNDASRAFGMNRKNKK